MLSVWNIVETVLGSLPSTMQTKMQIIRLRTDDNQRIVGKLSLDVCLIIDWTMKSFILWA